MIGRADLPTAERSDAWRECCVEVGKKLRDALWALERGNVQIAFIVDDAERLVGTITDGDVRRALLQNATLDSPLEPYVQRQFVSVDAGASRPEVLDLMQARVLRQIPVLDTEGRLIGLHLLHQMLGLVERPNWAIVMAGGQGQRLRPLTENTPKPMLRVAGRPILERIVLHLAGFGIRRIFLAVNYLSQVIEDHFGSGERFGCRIEYIREQKPLGTGGALSLLPERPPGTLLALNGDLITQFDVGRLLAFHEQGGFAASVAVHEYLHTVPFGVAEVSGDRILELREKPSFTWSTNAGIYALSPSLIERIPRDVDFPLPALVADCLARREPVGAFKLEGEWIDVGRTDELRRARGHRP